MKLVNKKTGEIGYPYFQNWKEITCVIVDENAKQIAEYISLAKLNEEWEVYEEPEGFYYIRCNGDVELDQADMNSEHGAAHKEIGNYFDTREEAEKAVEKLKAWKRLKDKGFDAVSSSICGSEFIANFKLVDKEDYSQSVDDFDCILGLEGEE